MKNVERYTIAVSDATLENTDGRTHTIPVDTQTALLNLCLVLRTLGLDADLESDKFGIHNTLTICAPEPLELIESKATKGGRPQRGTWPEGLDTDEQRLEWLDSVTVEEAMRVLGVSQSTVYRRIDSLSKKVRGRA